MLRANNQDLESFMNSLPLENVGSSRQMAIEFAENEQKLVRQHQLEREALRNAVAEKSTQLESQNA